MGFAGSFGSSDLQVCNAQAAACEALTNTPDLAESDPLWSPDGQRLVFLVLSALGREQDLGVYSRRIESSEPAQKLGWPAGLKTGSRQVQLDRWDDFKKQWVGNSDLFKLSLGIED